MFPDNVLAETSQCEHYNRNDHRPSGILKNMSQITITVEQLRGLIGLRVIHQNESCRVIEVIEDSLSIVVEHEDREPAIQSDQHGHAHRKVPQTTIITVLNATGDEFDQGFLSLELIE